MMGKEIMVMTIVSAGEDSKPIIMSKNIPGNVRYHENEIAFLKQITQQLEEESKNQQLKDEKWQDSSI